MLALVVRILTRLLFRVEVHGTLEKHDKLLIVANHQSFLDGILLGAWLPVAPTWLVHSQIAARAPFKYLLPLIKYLVIDSANPLSIKQMINLVDAGSPIAIFPEGRITMTGALMKIYEGPAMVAAKTGCAIVAVHIDGALYQKQTSRMSGDFPQRWFPKITLTVHRPQFIPMPEAPNGKMRRQRAADQLRRIMQRSQFDAYRPRTIPEEFLDAVDRYGKGRGMVEDIRGTGEDSYATILKAALALGRILAKRTAVQDCVGLLLPNMGPTVYLLLGLLFNRRIPALLNFTAGQEGLQSAVIAAKMKLLVTSRAFLEKARLTETVQNLKGVEILYLEDLRSLLTTGDKLWLVFYALRFPRQTLVPADLNDPAVVLFTSGSEGKPKGVVLSHRNILSNIAQLKTIIPFTCADKFMSALPMFHSFGLTIGTVLPLLNGCRIFFYPSPLHYRIVPELTYDRDCTVICGTNTFLKHYGVRAHAYDFRSVRIVVQGAEKLSSEVRQLWYDKFGLRITEGYGATECAPVITANSPFNLRIGTVGQLMTGMDFAIEPVPGIDEGGLLHVKGPNVMLGYWRDSNPGVLEPPSSEFGPGWYSTGDIAWFDDDGYCHLRGRMKRFAKVAGEMVSLEVVERIAAAASPHKVHASIAMPDANRGEVILLYTTDAELRREQLQAAAREIGAPDLALPRRLVVIDKIPLLGNGKKDYVTLQKAVREGVKA